MFSSGGFRGETVSLSFPALRGHPHSLAHGSLSSFSQPVTQYFPDLASIVTFPSDRAGEDPPLLRPPVITSARMYNPG